MIGWDGFISPTYSSRGNCLRGVRREEIVFPCRYVSWSATLLKSHPKLCSTLGNDTASEYAEKMPIDQKVYFQYYVHDETEVGTLMDTRIPISEVSRNSLTILDLSSPDPLSLSERPTAR